MAITFQIERGKKQKHLIIVLVLLILSIAFVIWWGFLRKAPAKPPPIKVAAPKEIKINWKILKDPKLEELEPYLKIPPFENEVGRENPFLPY